MRVGPQTVAAVRDAPAASYVPLSGGRPVRRFLVEAAGDPDCDGHRERKQQRYRCPGDNHPAVALASP